MGAGAAEGRLMWLESDRDDNLERVIWESFTAKVQAEIMQGVGYSWDGHILLKNNPKKAVAVPKELLEPWIRRSRCWITRRLPKNR